MKLDIKKSLENVIGYYEEDGMKKPFLKAGEVCFRIFGTPLSTNTKFKLLLNGEKFNQLVKDIDNALPQKVKDEPLSAILDFKKLSELEEHFKDGLSIQLNRASSTIALKKPYSILGLHMSNELSNWNHLDLFASTTSSIYPTTFRFIMDILRGTEREYILPIKESTKMELVTAFKGAIKHLIHKRLSIGMYLRYIKRNKSIDFNNLNADEIMKLSDEYSGEMEDFLENEVERIFLDLMKNHKLKTYTVMPFLFGMLDIIDMLKEGLPHRMDDIRKLEEDYSDMNTYKSLMDEFVEIKKLAKTNGQGVNEDMVKWAKVQHDFINLNQTPFTIGFRDVIFTLFTEASSVIVDAESYDEIEGTVASVLAEIMTSAIKELKIGDDNSSIVYADCDTAYKLLSIFQFRYDEINYVETPNVRFADQECINLLNKIQDVISCNYVDLVINDDGTEVQGMDYKILALYPEENSEN